MKQLAREDFTAFVQRKNAIHGDVSDDSEYLEIFCKPERSDVDFFSRSCPRVLGQKPDVKVTMKVEKGKFSKPNKSESGEQHAGGGTEPAATSKIRAKIKKVEKMT